MSIGLYFPPGTFPGDDPSLAKKNAEERKTHSEFVKSLGRGEAIGIPHQDAQEKEPEKNGTVGIVTSGVAASVVI
jgi:hypothetical protein